MPGAAFFFNDTATTEIYTLSLHDALPILHHPHGARRDGGEQVVVVVRNLRLASDEKAKSGYQRSEEHTSELQSRQYLVCRLVLGDNVVLVAAIPLLPLERALLPFDLHSGD